MPLDSVRDAFQRIEIVIKQGELVGEGGGGTRLDPPSRRLRNVKSAKKKKKKGGNTIQDSHVNLALSEIAHVRASSQIEPAIRCV